MFSQICLVHVCGYNKNFISFECMLSTFEGSVVKTNEFSNGLLVIVTQSPHNISTLKVPTEHLN